MKESKVDRRKTAVKARPFSSSLFTVMIIVTVLQLITFMAVLLFGGEFTYIRQYAFESFTEKNANRKNYIENVLTGKMSMVYDSAMHIARYNDGIFADTGRDARDIKTDKELNRRIVAESADYLVSLLRQDQVNDVFMVLDTGELYNNGPVQKRYGIYIRDIDPGQNDISDNKDLLMETGNSDIASAMGIVLDYEWAALFDVSDTASGRFDFFYKTMETAERTGKNDMYSLSGWFGFSGISQSAEPAIKFASPLISADGSVYGVVGIGITEKYFTDMFPTYDNIDNDICYVLGTDFDNDGKYDVQMHMGPMFSRLVTDTTSIDSTHRIEGDIYDFNYNNDINSIGNIQEMTMYNSASEYRNRKWAVIAIGDRNGTMALYNGLLDMLFISSVISIVLSITGAVLLGKRITYPVEYMIRKLEKSSENRNDVIRFAPTNISELNILGGTIEQLQINVRENASRVSKLIGMVDLAPGVFMYDYSEKTVFIGESLIKLLEMRDFDGDKDEVISFDRFLKFMAAIDKENKVCSDRLFTVTDDIPENEKDDIVISCPDMHGRETVWLKFSLIRDKTDVIGLVQDITDAVLEKKRVEFERDYDVTTGLLNRRAYLARLDSLFGEPDKLKTAAVIMIDLDNLKYVNDTYGHDFGDDYIRAAASVFGSMSRYGGIAARISGDEFNIFIYGYDSKKELRGIIKEIQNGLSDASITLANGTVYKVRASGGVAWYPDDADNYETLIKYADFSMYTIKHSTKGSIAEFDRVAYNRDSILITGIEEMNRIFENESVRFAFQPIVSAESGEIFGHELLMRPISEKIKTPLDFIRLARTSSKLYEVERLTWIKGLESFGAKLESGEISRGTKVFINSLSNCMINAADIEFIEEKYKDILQDIVLEVLEGEQENEIYTEEKRKLLKKWNARIALDDFGSGYNGELLFIKISPDIIKIDRSLITNCDANADKRGIISEIIHMAKRKNCIVLAEGVETAEELKTVISCGVSLIQGYYVSKPLFDPKPIDGSISERIRELMRY